MTSILQVSELRDAISPIHNWDMPLQMYYDETNNIRRLTLTEVGLNAPVNNPFVIAGISTQNGLPVSSEESLRDLLTIQKTANEIKYKHIAHSSYERALESKKLSLLLNWLIQNNVLIHYSVLDVLYWSILDIIESLMPDDPLGINMFHLELKSELYHIVRQSPAEFLTLLHRFGYPNLERSQVSRFLEEVSAFLDAQDVEDRNLATPILKQTIGRAARLKGLELPFLHDNETGKLVDDFSMHFLHCMYLFKNASHTFDRETYVQKALTNIEVRDGDNRLDYQFVDSKEELRIQISDVVAGLIGRHFGFVQVHSLPVLRKKKETFSQVQLDNLILLRSLIDRSDDFSKGLLHTVAPLDTIFKNDAFLHDRNVPDFLG